MNEVTTMAKRAVDHVEQFLRDHGDQPVPDDLDTTPAQEFVLDTLAGPMKDGTYLRGVAAARKAVEAAEAALVESIRAAVAAGDSWTMIGLALHTSKQNAHRKYAALVEGSNNLVTNEWIESVSGAVRLLTADAMKLFQVYHPTTCTEEVNMPNNNERHVVPGKNGGWDVVKPGSDRVSSHHDRQSDAIDRGRDIVRNAGGGELNIHGRDGAIRAKDTIAPGNDPRNIPG